MHLKAEALAQIHHTATLDPPFDEQFVIYREIMMTEDVHTGVDNGESLDVVGKFAYESSYNQCQEQIVKSAQLHLEFWMQLREERPDMTKLVEYGSRIN